VTKKPDAGKRDWRWRLASFLLGAASGMTTNVFTGANAYRAIGASVTLATLLMASAWLRTLPPRAPLIRYANRTMLALAFSATVIAAFGPSRLTPYMVFSAVAFGTATILIPTNNGKEELIFLGLASIAVGVVIATRVTALLISHEWLFGLAGVGLEIAIISAGIGILVERDRLTAIAFVSFGVGPIGFGIALLITRHWPAGAAVLGMCVATIGMGVALLFERVWLLGVALVGGGVAVLGGGAALLLGREWLPGAASIGCGFIAIGFGFEALVDQPRLAQVAKVSTVVALVGVGIAFLLYRQWMAAITMTGTALGLVGFDLVFQLSTPEGINITRHLTKLIREPNDTNDEQTKIRPKRRTAGSSKLK
jgi:hypothetical protein